MKYTHQRNAQPQVFPLRRIWWIKREEIYVNLVIYSATHAFQSIDDLQIQP
jgi:hypothetical protein